MANIVRIYPYLVLLYQPYTRTSSTTYECTSMELRDTRGIIVSRIDHTPRRRRMPTASNTSRSAHQATGGGRRLQRQQTL